MSAEAMAHVLRYSQHSGTTYTVLLCIADSVNDQHGYELWMAVPNLAAKSRVSERSTFRALVELEESGWLVRVEERPGKTVRYRLIMDGSRQVQWESQWTPDKVASPDKVAVLPLPNASLTPDTVAPKPNRTQKEPKQSEPDEFDEFWTVYPRKVGKGAARKAWAAAKKKEQGRVIVVAALWFANWCSRERTEAQFIPHPATWLNHERWLDERPNVKEAVKPKSAAEILEEPPEWIEALDGEEHTAALLQWQKEKARRRASG